MSHLSRTLQGKGDLAGSSTPLATGLRLRTACFIPLMFCILHDILPVSHYVLGDYFSHSFKF